MTTIRSMNKRNRESVCEKQSELEGANKTIICSAWIGPWCVTSINYNYNYPARKRRYRKIEMTFACCQIEFLIINGKTDLLFYRMPYDTRSDGAT